MAQRWLGSRVGQEVSRGQLSRFRQEVEGERFPNRETGNQVLFDSLPQKEQARYFAEWLRKQRGLEPKPEKVRGLVEVDRKDAKDRAKRLADIISTAKVRDPDERIGDRFVMGATYGMITVTDVRGRVFQRPLKVGLGKPTPGLWRAGRHFVTGGSVKVRHHGEKDPGMPTEVRIDLNPEVSYADLAKGRDRLEREIYSVLIHEMTHARDVLETPSQKKKLREKHEPPQDAPVSMRSRAENEAYYNRPSEVRAFKRQVADEFEQVLRRKYKEEQDPAWISVTAERVLRVLEESPTWDRVRHFLTPQNRRKFLETVASVARSFKEERGGKVASYPQEFLDSVDSERYRNPETDYRVKFVSLPAEEQAQIYERWKQRRTQGTKAPSDPKLKETGQETWQGGKIYRAEVENDTFVHFTPRSRAQQILDSGKLLANPPYKKMGISGVQAISLGYGSHSPEVQTKHIKDDPTDPMVAVLFQTSTGPKHGYSEEVIWEEDVDLHEAKIVDSENAKKLIDAAPKRITEDDMVTYGPSKRSASAVAAAWLRRAISFEEWVEGQRFPSPKTRRKILFKSLPPEEQEEIRAKWRARVEQESGKPREQPSATKRVKAPLYHTTSHARLEAIAEHGLSPRSGEGTFSHGGYAEHSQGKVFLSDSPKAARAWHSKVHDQLEDKHGDDDDVSKRVPVMLRVKTRKTRRDEVGDEDIPGSRYTSKGVPPEDIEFWHPKKKRWIPVSDWGEDTSAEHAVSSRDEEDGVYVDDEAFMPKEDEAYDRDDSETLHREREERDRELERNLKERSEREQKERDERDRQYLEPAARREWINRIKEHGAKSPIPGLSTAPGVFPKMWQTRLKVDEKGEPLADFPFKEAQVTARWLDSILKNWTLKKE